MPTDGLLSRIGVSWTIQINDIPVRARPVNDTKTKGLGNRWGEMIQSNEYKSNEMGLWYMVW